MLKIPVVIGKNRLRGNATGALVHDDFGEENLNALRNALREEAKALGVEPETNWADWLGKAVLSLLKTYENAHANWLQNKNETIGHVLELSLPSGVILMLGDRIMLARLKG